MNPRAAVNDLHPFQGCPFGQLGYFSELNGEGGIRTHAPFRTNGFQDRLVMTTSIPLRIYKIVTQIFQRKKDIIINNLWCQPIIFSFLYYFYIFMLSSRKILSCHLSISG